MERHFRYALASLVLAGSLAGCATGAQSKRTESSLSQPPQVQEQPLCAYVDNGDTADSLATKAGVPSSAYWDITLTNVVGGVEEHESIRYDTVYADDLQAPGTEVVHGQVLSYVQKACFYIRMQ